MNLEERMRYAWTAYKERWAREEEHLNNLSEQKKVRPEKGSNFLKSPKQKVREFTLHCVHIFEFVTLKHIHLLSCTPFLNCCLGKKNRERLWSI